MLMRFVCSLALLSGAAALQVAGRPAALASARHAAPTMQFGRGGGSTKEQIPKGWKKVPSNSRPGKFSYLNTKTNQRYDSLPQQNVYDDEVDTYASRFQFWKADDSPVGFEGEMDDLDAQGFGEGGQDLANQGLGVYLAFVPFLLFFFAYSTGAFSFGYDTGNF